ncbi:hypothetical protein CVT25_009901 [Psilocybe cyanescens]|uniref:Uncharacterized protein n=1 Tax=Psilocybe cyanescens TaxID=93625 RepID=A0A409XTA9_PSICY|nr:hypothetical protein CVT25_009901 [Psilocybe cyanescens]
MPTSQRPRRVPPQFNRSQSPQLTTSDPASRNLILRMPVPVPTIDAGEGDTQYRVEKEIEMRSGVEAMTKRTRMMTKNRKMVMAAGVKGRLDEDRGAAGSLGLFHLPLPLCHKLKLGPSRDARDDELNGPPAPAPCHDIGAPTAPLVSGTPICPCTLPAAPALYEAHGGKLSSGRLNFKFRAERDVNADVDREGEGEDTETIIADWEDKCLGLKKFRLYRLNGRKDVGKGDAQEKKKRRDVGEEGRRKREGGNTERRTQERKGGKRQQNTHPSFNRTICGIRSFIL